MELPLKHISWAVTNRCNLKCRFCFVNSGLKEEITLEEAKERIFVPLKKLGGQSIGFTGGEPLLREGLLKLIRDAKDYDFITSMVTNGVLINEKIARELKQTGLDRIQISLDSAIEEENDRIRGEGVFKKVTEHAIPLLIKQGFDVTLVATPTPLLIDSFGEYIKLAKNLGIGKIYIRRLVVTEDRFGEGYKAKYKDFLERFIKIKRSDAQIRLFCGDPLIATLDEKLSKYTNDSDLIGGCSAGLNSLAVDEIGDVRACTRLPLVIGNVRKDDLEEIWLNDVTLKELRERENLLGKCGVCRYKWICGGCRAAAALRGESYLGEDPNCFY